ncbi:MAG TPA: hypothetical protein VG675_07305 [Bryobacteraceae bacterium]|nr:hypothetical protein [Bryobacteraceae bacterium]
MSEDALKFVPLRVVVKKGSKAAQRLTKRAGLNPAVLASGFKPTPKEDLTFHGGKTIQNLTFANFYIAGEGSWKDADIQNIDHALAAAMSDKNLNNVMIQYFGNQPITSKLAFSKKLPGDKPAVVSQGDVEALLPELNNQGLLDGLDFNSTVMNVLLPPGTILTDDEATSSGLLRRMPRAIPHEEEASSVDGLGGYHGSIHLTMSGVARTIYYAVGVYSEVGTDGKPNGIPVFPESWKNVVATFYHELNEARTDADVEDAIRTGKSSFLGWTSAQGEECGDFPVDEAGNNLSLVFKEVSLADGSGTVPVQFQYSNAVHGPEGPIAQPHPLQ